MNTVNYDIVLNQGADFNLSLLWKVTTGEVANLTGYTARMKLKEHKSDTSPIINGSFTTSNYITLGDEEGTILISVPGAITETYIFRRVYYDLELINSNTGSITRLLEGKIILSLEVTD